LERGRKSLDTFSIVALALAAIAVLIVVLAVVMPDLTLRMFAADAKNVQASAEERIRPLSQYYLPGEEHGAPEPVVETAAPVAPVATLLTGPQVYNEACIACHGNGIGGAPKFGDVGAWGPRIAQGVAVLHDHAINGYQGSTGYMPPKGARVDLSDKEISDAVDYMVAESR
jgi:cytochrome c5